MDGERISPQIGGVIGDATTAPMEEETEGALENRKPSVDHSSSIAVKLLQGWALMNEHCPQCYTPLVRNRQKKLYCVACSQWVLTEAEAKTLQQIAQKAVVPLEANNIQQNQPGEVVVPHSSIPSPGGKTLLCKTNGVNYSRVASLRGGAEDALEERHAKRFAADTAILNGNGVASTEPLSGGVGELPGLCSAVKFLGDGSAGAQGNLLTNTSAKPSSTLPMVDFPLNMEVVLSNTLVTVVQKVEETRRLIATTQNTNEIRQLLDVLLKFLETVTILKSLGIS